MELAGGVDSKDHTGRFVFNELLEYGHHESDRIKMWIQRSSQGSRNDYAVMKLQRTAAPK
jgi:hypothetical protein